MQVDWRGLTEIEKRIIKRLLVGTETPISGDISGYVGREIDEFGSLALMLRGGSRSAEDAGPRMVASAYFDDDNQRALVGPMVEILLFATGGVLSELQVFRSDGAPLKRPIDADELVLIEQRL